MYDIMYKAIYTNPKSLNHDWQFKKMQSIHNPKVTTWTEKYTFGPNFLHSFQPEQNVDQRFYSLSTYQLKACTFFLIKWYGQQRLKWATESSTRPKCRPELKNYTTRPKIDQVPTWTWTNGVAWMTEGWLFVCMMDWTCTAIWLRDEAGGIIMETGTGDELFTCWKWKQESEINHISRLISFCLGWGFFLAGFCFHSILSLLFSGGQRDYKPTSTIHVQTEKILSLKFHNTAACAPFLGLKTNRKEFKENYFNGTNLLWDNSWAVLSSSLSHCLNSRKPSSLCCRELSWYI